jgi:type VI secretion system protein
MDGGVLTRIARRAKGLPEPSELELVLEHLRCLLNTRQGGAAIDPAYGIPDLTDALHAYPLSASAICTELASTIRRYETRLQNVRVTIAEGAHEGMELKFEIHATLARARTPVRFATQVTRAGHITIR